MCFFWILYKYKLFAIYLQFFNSHLKMLEKRSTMCNDVLKSVKMCNVDTLLGSILSCLDEPQSSIIIIYQAAIYMYCYLLSSYLMQVHNATCVKITLEHKKTYLQ